MLWNSENISCHHKVLCSENSNTDMGLLLVIRIAVERRCIRPRYNPSGSQSANLAHLLLPRALSVILNEFRECLLFRFGSELQVKCCHTLLSRSLAEHFLALFLQPFVLSHRRLQRDSYAVSEICLHFCLWRLRTI